MAVYTSRIPIESPLTTDGDVLIYNNNDVRLPLGTTSDLLTVSGGLPSYQNPPGGGGGFTHGSKTRVEILAISSPSQGDTVYCTDMDRWFFYTGNSWQIPGETIEVKSSGTTSFADVVAYRTGPSNYVYTTALAANKNVAGVVVMGATHGLWSAVATRGIHTVATVAASEPINNYLRTSSTYGLATVAGTTPVTGAFGRTIEYGSSNLVIAYIRAGEKY